MAKYKRFAGKYSPDTQYEAGDIVSFDGAAYYRKVPGKGVSPLTNAKFTVWSRLSDDLSTVLGLDGLGGGVSREEFDRLSEEIAGLDKPTDEQVSDAVNAYLNENPVQPTPIDDTLTVSGAAADAEKTGKAIDEITNNKTLAAAYIHEFNNPKETSIIAKLQADQPFVYTLSGKNIVDMTEPKFVAINGNAMDLKYSVEEGSVSAAVSGGNGKNTIIDKKIYVESDTEYTLSADCSQGGTGRILVQAYADDGSILSTGVTGGSYLAAYNGFYGTSPRKFVFDSTVAYIKVGVIWLTTVDGVDYTGTTQSYSHIQLERGSTKTDFVIGRQRKNASEGSDFIGLLPGYNRIVSTVPATLAYNAKLPVVYENLPTNVYWDKHGNLAGLNAAGDAVFMVNGKGISGHVTPQAYGAVADGVTDDTEAIQAALNEHNYIFFTEGTYLVSNTIRINKSNTILRGVRGLSVIKCIPGFDGNVIEIAASSVKMFDMVVSGNGNTANGVTSGASNKNAVYLNNATGCVFYGCEFKLSGEHGLKTSGDCWAHVFDQCKFAFNMGNGLETGTGINVTAFNMCHFLFNMGSGLTINGTSNHFTHCIIEENYGDGISMATTSFAYNNTIYGTDIEGNHGAAISFGDAQRAGGSEVGVINFNYNSGSISGAFGHDSTLFRFKHDVYNITIDETVPLIPRDGSYYVNEKTTDTLFVAGNVPDAFWRAANDQSIRIVDYNTYTKELTWKLYGFEDIRGGSCYLADDGYVEVKIPASSSVIFHDEARYIEEFTASVSTDANVDMLGFTAQEYYNKNKTPRIIKANGSFDENGKFLVAIGGATPDIVVTNNGTNDIVLRAPSRYCR